MCVLCVDDTQSSRVKEWVILMRNLIKVSRQTGHSTQATRPPHTPLSRDQDHARNEMKQTLGEDVPTQDSADTAANQPNSASRSRFDPSMLADHRTSMTEIAPPQSKGREHVESTVEKQRSLGSGGGGTAARGSGRLKKKGVWTDRGRGNSGAQGRSGGGTNTRPHSSPSFGHLGG